MDKRVSAQRVAALVSGVFGFAAAFLVMPRGSNAQQRLGPSFACGNVKDTLAVLICSDSRLARTDLAFVQAYQALREQVGDQGQRDLRQQANEFQNGVYLSCGLPRASTSAAQPPASAVGCVGMAYEQQRAAWLSRLSGPASQEAMRPLERHLQLQRELQALGYLPSTSIIDGVYGTGMRSAVVNWQRSTGLEATGFLSDDDARRLDMAFNDAGSALQAEADRARTEAAAAARGQAEREAQQRADQDRAEQSRLRDAALAKLEGAMTAPHDVATLYARLGSTDERVRKSLKGGYVLLDASRPARGCMTVGTGGNPAFYASVIRRVAGSLLGTPVPNALRACTVDILAQSDLVLLFDPADASSDRETADALTDFVTGPDADQVGHLSVADWETALANERQAYEQRAKARADAAAQIRAEALDGSLQDWGAVQLPERISGTACVVATDNPGWASLLGDVLPGTPAGAGFRVVADTDADRQFGRLLSGGCTVLVAHGSDLGDVLRGLDANRRTADVLPVRIPQASVDAALSGKPLQAGSIAPTTAVAPPVTAPVKPPAQVEVVPPSTP